ncbi:hypothetical protein ALO95_101652 [Pseudomonas syringae pv. antirrhini]|uniref:Uncharacterized protein n=1 Tax=Pseudomonas syringae pv. antirrhini TaxID=251702 RepID=A0A0N8QQ57_9PSED|nr:hypothetical protein ALO88_101968 [Pseudomonas syringae pv. antirrhini]RMP30981.1 hypothetical protein ALQ24_102044 [Pseudomonas syringae pv. antirrhini]RMP44642.1 hypothetical protein ALQ23_101792 [Pseudomonas syringae pv. antirrhini]RMW25579.1 hypothetical protein ALO95_101652 [Pseudomonas syringae pv. antirrhini]
MAHDEQSQGRVLIQTGVFRQITRETRWFWPIDRFLCINRYTVVRHRGARRRALMTEQTKAVFQALVHSTFDNPSFSA